MNTNNPMTAEEILKKYPCNRVLKAGKEFWGRHTLLRAMEESNEQAVRLALTEAAEKAYLEYEGARYADPWRVHKESILSLEQSILDKLK